MREQLTPAASISRLRLSTADSQLFSCNSLSFTLLSKNAPANHLESNSCKNKGLKVPCFHTLTKKGVGEGVLSNLQPHTSNLRSSLSPLDSALTSKRGAKSFTSNTYEKHTQGEGGPVQPPTSDLQPPLFSTVLHSAAQRRASNRSKMHFPALQGDHRHGNRRTYF